VGPSVGDARVVIVALGVSVRRLSPARTVVIMASSFLKLDNQVGEIVHQVVDLVEIVDDVRR
jgi:hypothetical protein